MILLTIFFIYNGKEKTKRIICSWTNCKWFTYACIFWNNGKWCDCQKEQTWKDILNITRKIVGGKRKNYNWKMIYLNWNKSYWSRRKCLWIKLSVCLTHGCQNRHTDQYSYFLFSKVGQSINRLIWFNDSVVFDRKEGNKHAQNDGAFLY